MKLLSHCFLRLRAVIISAHYRIDIIYFTNCINFVIINKPSKRPVYNYYHLQLKDNIFRHVLETQFAQTGVCERTAAPVRQRKMYGPPLIRGNWKLLYDARKHRLSSFAHQKRRDATVRTIVEINRNHRPIRPSFIETPAL